MLLKLLSVFLLGLTVSLAPVTSYAVDDDEDTFEFETSDYDEDEYDYEEEDDVFADDTNTNVTYQEPGAGDDIIQTESLTLNTGAEPVNVGNFDIAGIMLGMSFDDVHNLYYNHGNLYYPRKKNSLVYTIPQDWKYNLDYECRQSGVIQPNKLEKCIRGLARSRGLLYVSEIHLERVKTGETIDVYLTSNATDNVVYKIIYNNDVNEIEGKKEKFEDQRDKKRLVFWKNVVQKYGMPNSGENTWITSTNSYDPKMKVYYGSLELVDEGRNAVDVATSAQQSKDNFPAKPYAF